MVATPTRQTSPPQKVKKPFLHPSSRPEVVWEKLPEDFVLPDDPVDNINQPPLAAALTDSLSLAGYLSETAATTTNYGICAKVEGKTVVKAPDWAWIPATSVPKSDIERSYTPVLEGDLPVIVMEFLSESEGTEYSIKPSYPPGKWFDYERVLQVPNYLIFEPKAGRIEFYRILEKGLYEPIQPNDDGRYWVEEAKLFIGTWQGKHQDRSGWWLRWWDTEGELLLWAEEMARQEQERADQERERAEQERERAEQAELAQQKAIKKLVEMGMEAAQVAEALGLSVESVQTQLQQ